MNINPTANAGAASTAQPSQTTRNRAVSSDFETFLKMLTAQMQNQDPLNPIQSSDYAVQLATFSGVEQQVRTNDLLATLGQQLGGSGLAQLAGWVGMEGRVAAPAQFTGSPLTVYPKAASGADSAKLIVTDQYGAKVSQQDIDPNTTAIDWAGVDASGQPYASGTYTFTVESYAAGKLISSDQAEIYSTIREVKLGDGGVMVVLDGGTEVASDAISALRSAGG
jgi:flagellar basal-body rod modification protein FlgD